MPLRAIPWKHLIWYLGFGLALPWITFLASCIWYGRLADLLKLPERLFGAGYNYFAIGCLDAIPFVVVAGAVALQRSFRKESRYLQFGLVAAEIATMVLSVAYQTAAWFNMLGPHPDSLIGIAFIIFPALITAVSIAVGALAWAAAAIFR